MGLFSVATMNLRNLHLAGARRYPNSVPYSEDEYRRKRNWTGHAIKTVSADLIGFQELWSRQALTEALDRVNLDDDYELAGPAADAPNRIWNALAVRRPHELLGFEYVAPLPDRLVLRKNAGGDATEPGLAIAVDTDRFSRDVLIARVRLVDADADEDLPEVRVIVAHLKSKRPMRLGDEVLDTPGLTPPDRQAIGAALSTIKRTAESAGLGILISREQRDDPDDDGAGRPVIVLGDLNDSQLSNTLNILTTQPTFRLEAASAAASSSKWGLYSAATLQELRSLRDVYYSYIHTGFRESLDHILVSQQFYDFSRHRIWSFSQTQIYNDHLESAGEGNDNANEASDHGLVKATFELNQAG